MSCRLPQDADNPESRADYLYTRARQLLSEGYVVDRLVDDGRAADGKATMILKKDDKLYASLYISPEVRGKGMFKQMVQDLQDSYGGAPIITIRDCNIAGYLEFNQIVHVVETGCFDTEAYGLIEAYYGNRTARRSDVWLMNHIDEGLAVLSSIGAPPEAFSTFCLHPLVQNDADLESNEHLIESHPHLNWQGAFEYRHIANAYLANRDISSISDIQLSGNPAVNYALVADKVQNYKDFMLYHYGSHANSDRLFDYFHNWFDRLAINSSQLIDLLIKLYDNDNTKAINSSVREHQIPRILTHTQIERENRSQPLL